MLTALLESHIVNWLQKKLPVNTGLDRHCNHHGGNTRSFLFGFFGDSTLSHAYKVWFMQEIIQYSKQVFQVPTMDSNGEWEV